MTRKPAHPAKRAQLKKSFPWTLGIIVIAAAVFLPAGGFTFAAAQESHDAFCGSCHTEPESTYLQRSTAAQPVDLASYHTPQNTRCIDCHSGEGLVGRLQAEMMGAGNALRWFTKTAVQPAPLTRPITDGHCLKCHANVSKQGYVPKNQTLQNLGEAENGHWHLFLPRWQARSSSAAACVSCHTGHALDGDARILYLNEQHTAAVCDACHQVMGED